MNLDLLKLNNLSHSGEELLDLGLQPVSNRFPDGQSGEPVPAFPMQLRLESETGLIHLAKPFPVEEMKPRYDWLTCFEPEAHLDALADRIAALPHVTPSTKVGAYSFKDDTTLRRLENRGLKNTWRIDPKTDLLVTDPQANVETFQAFFTPEAAARIKQRYGGADIFIVRHVVEHAYDLPRFIEAVKTLLNKDGIVVWELPDCERALDMGDCTTLWEEHVFYFTSFTFDRVLRAAGFQILHFESVPYLLENSLIALTRPGPSALPADAAGLARELERARGFSRRITSRGQWLRETLSRVKSEKGRIAMFGAGHLSIAFLSLTGVADLVDFVIDDNPNKIGRLLPVGGLRIVGSQSLYSEGVQVCLLSLNPQNQPAVLAKHAAFSAAGGVFASIFPGGENSLEKVFSR